MTTDNKLQKTKLQCLRTLAINELIKNKFAPISNHSNKAWPITDQNVCADGLDFNTDSAIADGTF